MVFGFMHFMVFADEGAISLLERHEELRRVTRVEHFIDDEGYHEDVQKRQLFERYFFELFSNADFETESLSKLSSDDKRLLYGDVFNAVFWTQDIRAVGAFEKLVRALRSEGEISQRDVARSMGLINRTGEFERVRKGLVEYGINNASTYPEISRKFGLSSPYKGGVVDVWRVRDGGRRLVLEQVSRPNNQVVMVMSLQGCSSSQVALEEIASDAQLNAFFKEHGQILSAPVAAFNFQDFAEWNERQEGMEAFLVNKMADWSEIRTWATPSFYFYKKGELVDYQVGWKDKETLKEAINNYLGFNHEVQR